MNYRPLYEVNLAHPYYADGTCSDFTIEPSERTRRLLRNYRCVLKAGANLLRVMNAFDDGKPLIAPERGATFTFHMRLQNPDFPLFTDLSDFNGNTAPLFTNESLTSTSEQQLLLGTRTQTSRERLVVKRPAKSEEFALSGRPATCTRPSHFQVEGLGTTGRARSYEPVANIVTLDTSSATLGTTFTIRYPVQPKLTTGVFADVDIHVNDSLPLTLNEPKPRVFQIAFEPKRTHWVYYLVTDTGKAKDEFTIESNGNGEPAPRLQFSASNRTDLARNPDASDEIARMLAEQYPQMKRLRFVSDESVPCRETARKHIRLRVDGSERVGSLPNPAPRNFTSMRTSAQAAATSKDALFHIVKYFRHSFTSGG